MANMPMRIWLAITAALLAAPAAAEPVPLSEITRDVEIAMQRGVTYPDLVCLLTLAAELRRSGAAAAYVLEFDEPPPTIFSDPAGLAHTCVDGVHTLHDAKTGTTRVIQIYDLNGDPTLPIWAP
jgi:hypothetical protein